MTLFELCKVIPSDTCIFIGCSCDDRVHWVDLNRLLLRNKKINFDVEVVSLDLGNDCLNILVDGSL